MNSDSDIPSVEDGPETAAVAAADTAVAEPPKRRASRPKRVKEADPAAAEAAAEPTAQAPAAADAARPEPAGESLEAPAEPKPRRPRRSAKPEAPAPEMESAPIPVAATEPAAAPTEAAAHASLEAPLQAATETPGDTTDTADTAQQGESASPEAAPQGSPESGDERRSRRRNRRRRGRRDVGEPGAALAADSANGPSGADDDDAEDGAEEGADAEASPVEAAFSTQGDPGELFAIVVTGDFDAEPPEGTPKLPAKRVLPAEPDSPKLQKVLAQAGVGSRRDMEQLIADGRITVNGEAAHIGQRISFGDEVRVAGKPIRFRIQPPLARVLAYHKPAGEVVTNDDPQHRPTVFRRLPRLQHGKWQSVGRLDINTEGLLLFTNSGDLANKLMHPRFGVEREYAVRVLGTLDEEARNKLLGGVIIDGQTAGFKSIEDGGGEGANHWYRVVITEGRNREVRKLFDAVGLAVSRLIRIRYGSVVLPKGLRRGVWIDLEGRDVQTLRRLAGADQPPQEGEGERPQRAEGGGERFSREGGGQRPQAAPPRRDRNDRNDRGGDRGPRADRNARGPNNNPNPNINNPNRRNDRRPEDGGIGTIPNPLQQTYDRRPLPRDRDLEPIPEHDEEEIGPIPNPLQQTYDRRFVQKPKGGGQRGGGDGPRQPDPMQTSMGYIGADTFLRKVGQRGPRRKR
jgi:23S rRNA pseudouridine2605 synthase